MAAIVGIAGCGDTEPVHEAGEDGGGGPDDASLVFRSERLQDAQGTLVHHDLVGELAPEVAARAARPYSHFSEKDIIDEQAWVVHDGGQTRTGYSVTRKANPTPLVRVDAAGPPRVDEALTQELERAGDAELLTVAVHARGMPEWDVPLRAAAFGLAAADAVEATRARHDALEERAATARRLIAATEATITRDGGKVLARGRYGAWMAVRATAAAVRGLLGRNDLSKVALMRGQVEEHDYGLGNVRWNSRTNADRLIDAGYTGERSNGARHGYGDITVGVIESGLLEDEACFLYDGAGCTGASRLRGRYVCTDNDDDGNMCESVANFSDTDDNASHGTKVASVILGDYMDGQADGVSVGDAAWVGGAHAADWERSHTGMAPEASLVFFGDFDSATGDASFADAFDDAVDLGLDITNSSWGWSGGDGCTMPANMLLEQELENAFDDGILNVVSAGNANSPGFTEPDCNMISPATVVKALSVNGLDSSDSFCGDDYHACTIDHEWSATGGLDAEVNGVVYAGSVTKVDLAAPTQLAYVSTSANTTNGGFAGTSAAAPVVSGAAALVKDWQLATGNTWINSPGRLHTMMLWMTDRYVGTWSGVNTSQRTWGADHRWGLGRLKLRLLENGQDTGPYGYSMNTVSFTSGSADSKFFAAGADPMPAGTGMVKCVLMQDEDMSGKDDISEIDLEVRIRDAVNGSCSSSGTTRYTLIDGRKDVKKLVAIESSSVGLAGRCIEVTLDKQHVTSSGITTHTMCGYTGIMDDVEQ